MKKFLKYFNYDHYGIKKKIYNCIFYIFPKKMGIKRKSSFYLTHNSKTHYLNLEKNEWNHPANLYETYNYSFIELYIIALDKACHMIMEIDKMLSTGKISDKKIANLFKNLSYTTGKDCDENVVMQYFEF